MLLSRAASRCTTRTPSASHSARSVASAALPSPRPRKRRANEQVVQERASPPELHAVAERQHEVARHLVVAPDQPGASEPRIRNEIGERDASPRRVEREARLPIELGHQVHERVEIARCGALHRRAHDFDDPRVPAPRPGRALASKRRAAAPRSTVTVCPPRSIRTSPCFVARNEKPRSSPARSGSDLPAVMARAADFTAKRRGGRSTWTRAPWS